MMKILKHIAETIAILVLGTIFVFAVFQQLAQSSVIVADSTIVCKFLPELNKDLCKIDGEEFLFDRGGAFIRESNWDAMVREEIARRQELKVEEKKIETLARLETMKSNNTYVRNSVYSNIENELRARQLVEQSA